MRRRDGAGWTLDTLREFMLSKFESQDEAVSAALAAAEKAVGKAETAAEKRFDSVNEFRGSLADQAATLMPRLEYENAHTALEDKMTSGLADMAARLTTSYQILNDKMTDHERRKEEQIERILELHRSLELRVTSRLDTSAGRDTGEDSARSNQMALATARNRMLGLAVAAGSMLIALVTLLAYLAAHPH